MLPEQRIRERSAPPGLVVMGPVTLVVNTEKEK